MPEVPPLPSERREREEDARRRAITIASRPYDPKKMRPRTSWGCFFICVLVISGCLYVVGRAVLQWLGVT
jgi:hypothetical protein